LESEDTKYSFITGWCFLIFFNGKMTAS